MRSPVLARSAAAVLMLESLGLVAVVVLELIQLISGEASVFSTALALIVLTGIAAATLAILAVGVARGRSWARSGAIVLQVLGVILTFAALTTDPPAPALAATVGIPSVLALVLVILSARAEGSAPDAAAEDGG